MNITFRGIGYTPNDEDRAFLDKKLQKIAFAEDYLHDLDIAVKKRKEGIEARNEADALAFQTEKALGEVGDKLSESDKAGVKADLDALRAAIDSTDAENMSDADVDKIKAAKDKLMESAQSLFSKLYEQNGPGANAGTGAGTPDFSDGDVVDGDFTEV